MSKKKTNTTIVDIARKLGVAHSTVSRALADSPLIPEKTRRKVKRLAVKMNYVKNPFANGLRTGQTHIIKLMYCTKAIHLYEDIILLTILDSFYHELEIQGYKILLNILKDFKPGQKGLDFRDSITDGTVLVSSGRIAPSYSHHFSDRSRCIVMDNAVPGYSSVNFHNDDFFQLLIHHIISKGGKNIAALIPDYKFKHSLRRRSFSYNKICRKYQHLCNNLGVITVKNQENPFPEIRKLKPAADAVICLNNSVLDKLMDYSDREGVNIQEDLIVGAIIDLEDAQGKYQKIPHITLNWPELVRQSVLCLISQLQGEVQPPVRKLIKSPLILNR